ncbi:hypothetical protein T05_12583, partial [Trichinella murrelli]
LRLGRSSLNAFQNGNSVLGDRFFRSSNSVAVTVAVRFFLVLLDVGQQRPALGYGWQFDRCDQPSCQSSVSFPPLVLTFRVLRPLFVCQVGHQQTPTVELCPRLRRVMLALLQSSVIDYNSLAGQK